MQRFASEQLIFDARLHRDLMDPTPPFAAAPVATAPSCIPASTVSSPPSTMQCLFSPSAQQVEDYALDAALFLNQVLNPLVRIGSGAILFGSGNIDPRYIRSPVEHEVSKFGCFSTLFFSEENPGDVLHNSFSTLDFFGTCDRLVVQGDVSDFAPPDLIWPRPLCATERCKFCNLCGKFRLLLFFDLLFHFPLYEQQPFHRDMKLIIAARFLLSRTKTGHSNPHNGAVETCTCRSCRACANKSSSHRVAIETGSARPCKPCKQPRKFARTMLDDFVRSTTCAPSFLLSRQTARAWPEGVEDDQHPSSQETKSDEEIESIVSGSNLPQIPQAIFSSILQDQSQISSHDSESSSDSESLPEPSTTELHDGNSPKRQKVIIFDWHSIR